MLPGEQAGPREGAVAKMPHGCQEKALGKTSKGDQQDPAPTPAALCNPHTLAAAELGEVPLVVRVP